MAITINNMSMCIGEDKVFIQPVTQSDGVSPQNVTGWTTSLIIHKYNDPDTVFLTKSCTSVYPPGSQAAFASALQVSIANADTSSMKPDQYGFYFVRTDSGNNAVISEGLFTLSAR